MSSNEDWIKYLHEKIKSGKAKIGIVGLGYVGLPLALAFTKRYSVYAYDLDRKKISLLSKGISYLTDISSEKIKSVINKKLFVDSSPDILSNTDVIIITVPTPIYRDGHPDMSYLISAVETVSKYIRKGMLIIIESTVYPGTTDEIVIPILEESSLKAGDDFGVVFSPERVTPGNKEYDVVHMPKVIGGIDKISAKLAYELYSNVLNAKIVMVRDCKTAEAVKMLENVFRFVNISLINELAIIFEELGIDIWEVIDAASTKPIGFMPHYPGPGIGGHCIPVDPMFMLYKTRRISRDSDFICLSYKINSYMPIHTINLLEYGLKKIGKSLRKSKIIVFGVAYKPDVNDWRESPAVYVIRELIFNGSDVDYYDPYIKEIEVMEYGKVEGINKIDEHILEKYDGIIVITPHKKMMDNLITYLIKVSKKLVIVDGRNAINNSEISRKHILLCIGKPRGDIVENTSSFSTSR